MTRGEKQAKKGAHGLYNIHRRKILKALAREASSTRRLKETTGLSYSTIYYHLRELIKEGLVTVNNQKYKARIYSLDRSVQKSILEFSDRDA